MQVKQEMKLKPKVIKKIDVEEFHYPY